jgi:hypothetical protein
MPHLIHSPTAAMRFPIFIGHKCMKMEFQQAAFLGTSENYLTMLLNQSILISGPGRWA